MRKVIIALWLLVSVLYCGLAWSQTCPTVNVLVVSEDGIGIEDAMVNCGDRYPSYTNKDGLAVCSNIPVNRTISVTYDSCYSSASDTVDNCSTGLSLTMVYQINDGCGSLCPTPSVENVASTITEGTRVNLKYKQLSIWHLVNVKLVQDKTYFGYVKTWADEANDGQGYYTVPTGIPTGYYYWYVDCNGERAKSNRFYIP